MSAWHEWRPQDLRLADDLYLMAHDDTSGAARLPARVCGIGLGAALLAELALDGYIEIDNGLPVVPLGVGQSTPTEVLAFEVFDHIKAEQLSVHDWLSYFSQSATQRVAERLARRGALIFHPSRIPLRPGRWIPQDANAAALPAVNLASRLMRKRPLEPHYATLGGLVTALGLDHHQRVLWEVHYTAPQRMRDLHAAVDALPAHLRELIAHTERSAASAIVTHRA